MPTPSALPRTLDAWIQELEKVRLPITPTQQEQLRRLLRDNRRSLREIAEQLQHCPAAALALLREANRGGSSLNQPAESLEIALTRLGLQRSGEQVELLPVLDSAATPHALRQLQLISQHAAQQAGGLFSARLARLWQEIHWSSLLFLAPLWPLAFAQPTLFDAWERRVLGAGEPARKVELELFGVPLLQLALQLAERWRLPEWIVQGYRLLLNDHRLLVQALHIARDNEHPLHQQQHLDAAPALRRWLTQPGNTILLANCLALSAHASWGSDHSLRWQRLTGLYLQLPLGEVQAQIHQQAASSARQLEPRTLWHPAQALLWPWTASHLREPEAPVVQPAAPASPDWRQHCAELLRSPSPFLNLAQLTLCAGAALSACGLPRHLLLLSDRQHSRLRGQQASGLPEQAQGLELDPAPSPLLRRLLGQPAQLRLSPANMAQYSALLPGTLKALFPSEHLLIRSLACKGRVAMLLFADNDGRLLDDRQVQGFGKTAQCIERALDQFAQRGR
ncbi:HDOD domain-containing protein [Pseudomonas sp. UL073]|uniref:HDOD domain-containing protein n=1 Tax=Zestomonas insulae TaxID=2809017 RepID=A0ABS2IDP5_9GAMM|nr:HDOD domain-containing protein [Pseudomonas insulae]MBM7061219.1 HDOD domain-containing protein [Pseudomonas insulae]